jgi:tripartite-type tricarboxylate transporter receptor subunit TctC
VVPFPPGGPVDAVGRIVAEVLARQFRQPLVVENRAGAGGTLGTDMVAKAAPDGYTLGIGPVSSQSIAPAMGVRQPFKVETDFTMISMLGKVIGAIVAHPAAPFSDLAGLVKHAKAHPGQLTFASSGIGT